MRIVCLPIDSRPCNTDFVRSLTEWAGGECVLPRAEEMDYFRRPAAFEASRGFLAQELPRGDAAVISLDHWVFGGLLASREDTLTEEEAMRRVEALRELLRACPGRPVSLSSVLLRSSISTLCRDDLDAYRYMTAYSFHMGRYARLRREEDRRAAREAEGKIPPALMEKMLAVRRRNLRVNLAALDLAAEGLVTSLSILQEDTQIDGLPRKDQLEIQEYIHRQRDLPLFLRNGTDEAGAVGAAQLLRRGMEPLPVEFRWLGNADFIADYEDRPFRENLESVCAQIGLRGETGAETVVLVCGPEPGASEGDESKESIPGEYLRAIGETADVEIAAGRRVYLLDVIRANGGALPLLRGMRHPEKLWGYSAWNTASNAMGTLLAQLATDHLRGASNRRFLQERMLDDAVYQGFLRQKLDDRLAAEGEDSLRLGNREQAETLLREMYARELSRVWPLPKMPGYQVSLPWDRTFEVRAEVKP